MKYYKITLVTTDAKFVAQMDIDAYKFIYYDTEIVPEPSEKGVHLNGKKIDIL